MAHYFSPIVKHIFQFFYFMARFILWCLFTILGRYFHYFFFSNFLLRSTICDGFARSDGRRKINKRYRSALAAHWSASSQEKRIGSVAARCVASRRAATERECNESAACALSLCYAGPLLSGLFPLDLQLRILSRLFQEPFRDCAM